jgi:uncharacterized protein (DUF885 family)
MQRLKAIIASLCFLLPCSSYAQNGSTLSVFIKQFSKDYQTLGIPQLEYDYKAYFGAIPDTSHLNKQAAFFTEEQKKLQAINYNSLSKRDQLHYDELVYECANNLKRVALEKEWVINGRNIPAGGLSTLKNVREWYALFVKRFTSLDRSPEDIYKLGLSETDMVKKQIARIQHELGFTDSVKFYQYLQSDTFLLRNKTEILARYARIDSTVRANLDNFIEFKDIPRVYAMEWPNADKYTPPGMYVNRTENAYNKDVFQFNFYGGKHNVRAMEWLYLHEAIPGHHLQSTLQNKEGRDDSILQQMFIYPGNFEGWACYVEYFGKELGVYKNPYSELGKWEWDLVRSVRVVLDVGIHYYGWDYNKAMAYWKANIPGQDAIADREITRITNWPCQVLSYKVGANYIKELKTKYIEKEGNRYEERKFHTRFIVLGMVPLSIMEKYMVEE